VPIPREQLRLTDDELDDLCSSTRTAHCATASPEGAPHVVPLWFVWLDGEIFVNNLRRSKRSHDLARGSRVALCIDDGVAYAELRGAVFYGRFVEAGSDERLADVRRRFAEKYWGGADVPDLRSHVWLRLDREKVVSWDFRKIPSGADRRLEAGR
jgi:nitroimidazol reductase NimA-like FMN-containing flavoprotein (pyridoxamine 5'-phosphate oxidase superfamily)